MDNGSFQFGYGNPASESDWTKYAGFNRTTGLINPVAAPQTKSQGVKPSPSLSDVYSNVKSSLQQGNYGVAAKALYGVPPVQADQQQIEQSPINQPDNSNTSGGYNIQVEQ